MLYAAYCRSAEGFVYICRTCFLCRRCCPCGPCFPAPSLAPCKSLVAWFGPFCRPHDAQMHHKRYLPHPDRPPVRPRLCPTLDGLDSQPHCMVRLRLLNISLSTVSVFCPLLLPNPSPYGEVLIHGSWVPAASREIVFSTLPPSSPGHITVRTLPCFFGSTDARRIFLKTKRHRTSTCFKQRRTSGRSRKQISLTRNEIVWFLCTPPAPPFGQEGTGVVDDPGYDDDDAEDGGDGNCCNYGDENS